MRRWVVAGVVAAFLVGGTVAVIAGTRRAGGGPIDRQTFRWSTSDVSTSTTEWSSLKELRTRTGCPGDPSTSATVSLELAEGSAPIETRVLMDDPLSSCIDCIEEGVAMRPGRVRITGSSSFTFVAKKAVGGHGTVFDVQWRLASGHAPNASATIDSGTMRLIWDDLDGTCM